VSTKQAKKVEEKGGNWGWQGEGGGWVWQGGKWGWCKREEEDRDGFNEAQEEGEREERWRRWRMRRRKWRRGMSVANVNEREKMEGNKGGK